jgi:hypothetical protein
MAMLGADRGDVRVVVLHRHGDGAQPRGEAGGMARGMEIRMQVVGDRRRPAQPGQQGVGLGLMGDAGFAACSGRRPRATSAPRRP